MQAAGSVLQTIADVDVEEIMRRIQSQEEAERLATLRQLGLRFFTPKEMANILAFPDDFSFPDTVTDRQKTRLLGNSVSCQVVQLLLRFLLISKRAQ